MLERGAWMQKNVRKRCLEAKIFLQIIVTRRVTFFVALSYLREIARDGILLTCEMDAVALKVYIELKSKCLFYEYLTSLFEKILPSGRKTELYVLVVGSVEKFHTQGIIVKTKSNGTMVGTNHSPTDVTWHHHQQHQQQHNYQQD